MKKTSKAKTVKKAVLEGVAVATGIAIGRAYVHDTRKLSAPDYKISQDQLEAELGRLKTAIADVVEETSKEIKAASPEAATMLKPYMAMLIDDKLVKSLAKYITDNLVNAEQAVSRVLDDIAQKLNDSDDDYLAERANDIHDIGVKIIQRLIGQSWRALDSLPEDTILLCDQLSVPDAVRVLPKKVLGFASQYGGVQGHTALLARAWGIPGLVAVDKLLDKAASDVPAIIDGQEGKVIINPSPAEIALYQKRLAEFQEARKALQDWVKKPAMTKDKVRVGIYANIDLMSNIPAGILDGNDGIGLLRTEYLFLNKEKLPSQDRQYLAMRNLVRKMRGKSVTIRLADIGADKSVDGRSDNQMGLRGIRYLLSRPDIMRPHVEAILRASRFGPVKIMLPTVCEVDDIVRTKKVIKEIHEQLR
ncbi:MAG: PEP-utilizing enzyme, partial [Alphaproteobacteria bacterium]|nr:PEP-utilizing enzyme [Alphaproteobacteria bacterium]